MTRIGESNKTAGRFTPWSFVFAADIHFGSPDSYRFDPARHENWATACKQMETFGPDLALIGGDLTRDGDPHEYEFQIAKDRLETLPMPYFVIPGNMDVGNKHTPYDSKAPDAKGRYSGCHFHKILNVRSETLRTFSLYFGPPHWSFVHKNVRFSGFYAGVAGSGLHEEALFWRFLERLPDLPRPRHHVAMMHYALFADSMDEPPTDSSGRHNYNSIFEPHRGRIFNLLKKAGVDIVLSGHIHCRRPEKVVDGIRFYKAPAVGGRPQYTTAWPDGDGTMGFLRLDVTKDNVDVRFVPVQPLSTLEARGPGGHFYTNDHAAKGFPDPYDDRIEQRHRELGNPIERKGTS